MHHSLASPFGILCLLLSSAYAREWSVSTFPNPNTSSGAEACHRGSAKGFICDPDRFLSVESADVIEGHIKQIQSAVHPYGSSGCRLQDASDSPGFQVAVAIAGSIAKEGDESVAAAARRFANGLFDVWGVGDKDCGNGLLLVLAFDDRQARIAQGSLISKFASEESLAAVLDNMKPLLREGNRNGAVEQAVIELGLVLAGADPTPQSDTPEAFPYFLVGGVVAFFSFLTWGIWKSSRQKKECMSLLEKLQKEQETAKLTGKYPAASCPICFEDLKPLKPAQPSAPPAEQLLEDNESSVSTSQPLLTKRKSRDQVDSDTDKRTDDRQEHPGSSGSKDTDGDSRKTPLCLPKCGHTFCTDCLSEWLQRNSNCPICRQDVGAAGTTRAQQQVATSRDHWDVDYAQEQYNREMSFRMRGLQRRYPQYIPSQAVERAIGGGGHVDFSSMRHEMMQPASRSAFQHSGHTGSSISFGGGSHSGAGVGSSW